MSFKLAVIGQTGQLARALVGAAEAHDCKAHFYSRNDCDLSQSATNIQEFLSALPTVDAIIIAAAYTAVDKAEEERDLAMAVNGNAPGVIAAYCKAKNIPLVHISTDYVFDGNGAAPYKPNHATNPVNYYGETKLAGETQLLSSGCDVVILRTSWVFDGTGRNFMTTMLRLAKDRQTLNVVGDQIGLPTFASHLADASVIAAKALAQDGPKYSGVYHVSGAGDPISWAEFATAIFDAASDRLPHSMTVNAIPTTEYPTPASRPAYSVMDISQFEDTFNYKLPTWTDGLQAALNHWAQ